MERHIFVGPIIQTDEKGKLIIQEKAVLIVENGKILSISNNAADALEFKTENVTHLKEGQFLVPGFIDGHIHAVQLPNIGLGYDKPLLEWLETYTFPLERKFSDLEYADKVFDAVVKRTLNSGTTTACYFASLYGPASLILAKKTAEYHQRAFIGKVNANASREDGYYENTKDSIENTKKFIEEVFKIGSPLVKPVITPRFALNCDMDLLKQLGKLAKERDLNVQTHISENLTEIEICKELFENCSEYADVYEHAGLLTNKTVLAHGVHLEDCELDLLRKYGTAVIHCPSSNTNLRSGLCDVKRLISKGVKVGLGTDVAGSESPCILHSMRAAMEVSVHLSFRNDNYEPLNYVDVFHLATIGGAKSLAIDDKVGSLVPGKEFDALLIDMNSTNSPVDNLLNYSLDEHLQRLIYSGDDRNIVQVFVAGHRVK